jgi:type II secretory pathway component PulF
MMTLKEIEMGAAALGNQGRAGIPLADATRRMRRLQKKHAEFWNSTASGIENGHRISEYLTGMWPEAVVNAVRAGEESGKLNEVFNRIEETTALQRQINGLVFKLMYPVVLMLSGIVVFIFFMTQVLPSLSQSLGTGNHGFVFDLSTWMTATMNNYWLSILIGMGVSIFAVIAWLKVPDNRESIAAMALTIPVLGDALRNLYFGLWSHYMALVDVSGSIPLVDGLLITSTVLPRALRPGLELMSAEIVARGMSNASDPEKQVSGDPRCDWPFYVGNAFVIAEQTGVLEVELLRAAPEMIKDGTSKLNFSIDIGNIIALAFAGLFIAGPIMAYYMQLGAALSGAMKG